MIDNLYVGVKSGNDKALKILNKGYTKEECIQEIKRLSIAAISSILSNMLSLLGKNRTMENEKDTAGLINKTKNALDADYEAFVGSQLRELVDKEQFILADELENLYEEIKLLKLINVPLDFMGIMQSIRYPLAENCQMPILIFWATCRIYQEQGPENLKYFKICCTQSFTLSVM